nr:hypothetical protein [Paenibacillus riograndensis]
MLRSRHYAFQSAADKLHSLIRSQLLLNGAKLLIIVISTRPYHSVNFMKILYAFYGVGIQKDHTGVFANIHGTHIIHPIRKFSPIQSCHLKNMERR